jgi:hypothetical protein
MEVEFTSVLCVLRVNLHGLLFFGFLRSCDKGQLGCTYISRVLFDIRVVQYSINGSFRCPVHLGR